MSTIYAPVGGPGQGTYEYDPDDTHGQRLVTFAGVMILIAGTLNAIYGIAAIGNAHFFVAGARYVFGDLNLWGWFVLGLGVVQLFAALAIWRGTGWARWFGVACAAVNVVLQLLWMPSAPLLALAVMTLDVIAMYALLVYGGRRAAANRVRAADAAAAG